MRMDDSCVSGKKKLRIQKYPDTCGRGLRESKTARKIVQVERGGGGEERKETLADKPRDFENRLLGLSCFEFAHRHLMLPTAVIIEQ